MEMVEIWKHVPSPVPTAGQVRVTTEDDHVIQGGEGDGLGRHMSPQEET